MTEPSIPAQTPRRGHRPVEAQRVLGDPAWLRPTLMFLLGLLLGTLIISASRTTTAYEWPPVDGASVTGDNPNCDRVVADARHLADMASRAANAAQHQDATSLGSLVRELNQTESTLDVDVTGCHR